MIKADMKIIYFYFSYDFLIKNMSGSYTKEELLSFDFGIHKGMKFKGEKIPTFEEFLRHQQSTLPRPMHYSMMNLLGSHDKPRIIDVLSGRSENALQPEHDKRKFVPLTKDEYALGKARFISAFEFLCHLPGMPCLYYGDEAGLTGGGDPFCRRTFPWGREDKELTERIRGVIRERSSRKELRTGSCIVTALGHDRIEIRREEDGVENIYTLSRI